MAQKFKYSGVIYDSPAASQVDFALTTGGGDNIPYLEGDHIHVYTADDGKTNWTEIKRGGGTDEWDFKSDDPKVVRFVTAPGTSKDVRLMRITPYDAKYTTFQEGSLLTSAQLNDGEDFSMYVDQEIFDKTLNITDDSGKPSKELFIDTADQKAQTTSWVDNDDKSATAGAISHRLDTVVGDGTGYPGSGNKGQDGKIRIDNTGSEPKTFFWDASLSTPAWVEIKGAQGPKGDPGPKGDAATIAVGTTTTLAAGSSATVTNSGSSSAAVFDFGIPKGDKGDPGAKGDPGDGVNYKGEIDATTAAQPDPRENGDFFVNTVAGTSSWAGAVKVNSRLIWNAAGNKWDVFDPVTTVDLGYTAATDKGTITNNAGADADIPLADATNAGLFTAAEKTKLEGIAEGAEVNVQSDWDQTDTSADDFIKNKPTIPDAGVTQITAGTNVTINPTDGKGNVTINASGGISGITVQEEGTDLTTAATTLNFTGAGVTASGDGATKTINVPGGTGGVTKIVAGSNVTISPTDGVGEVTINSSGGGGTSFWEESSGKLQTKADNQDVVVRGTGKLEAPAVSTPDVEVIGSDDASNKRQVKLDAPTNDAAFTADLTLTLPGVPPTATNRFIRAAGTGTGTDQQLEWAAGGGGGGAMNVEEDGTAVVAGATTLNFTGNGVTVTDGGNDTADIDIPFVGAAAWGDINDDGTILGNSNVATVVRTPGGEDAGDWTITFANPMPDANYAVTTGGSLNNISAVTKTVNSFRIQTANNAAVLTDSFFYFAVHAFNALPPRGGTGTDAWGVFDGSDPGTIQGSFNIASITRNSVGNYSVVFTNPMPDTQYAVVGSCWNAAADTAYTFLVTNKSSTGFDYVTLRDVGQAGDGTISYSDQAASFTVNGSNATLPLTITEDQIAALIQNPVLSAWAHVDMNGDGTNIQVNGSFNVTDVTRSDEGNYTVVFDNDIPGDYSVTCTSMEAGGVTTVQNTTAGNCQVLMRTTGGSPFDGGFYIQVAGTARNGTLGGGADAWVCFDGNPGTDDANRVRGGFNIDSVARNGQGNYTIRFANAFPNTNYCIVGSATKRTDATAVPRFVAPVSVDGKSVNNTQIAVADDTGNFDDCEEIYVAWFATDGNAGGFWVRNGQGATEVLSPLNDDADVEIGGGDIALNADGSADFAGTVEVGSVGPNGFSVQLDAAVPRVNIQTNNNSLQVRADSGGDALIFSGTGALICRSGNSGSNGVKLNNNATSWTSGSDFRMKQALVPITDGLNKVSTLRAVTGRYLTDEPDVSRAFLVAQDVQQVLPEAVDSSNPDELGLRYTEIIPLLVSALQDAKTRVETLESRLSTLEGGSNR